MAIITVPRPLREQLGEEASESLVALLNQANASVRDDVVSIVEEKFERRLSEEISAVRAELREGLAAVRADLREGLAAVRAEVKEGDAQLRTEFTKEIQDLRAELKQDIANLSAKVDSEIAKRTSELIRWMFLFWTGQVVVVLAILGFALTLLNRR